MVIWFVRTYDRHVKVYVDHAFDAEKAALGGTPSRSTASGTAFCGERFSGKPVTSKAGPSLPVCSDCTREIGRIFLGRP